MTNDIQQSDLANGIRKVWGNFIDEAHSSTAGMNMAAVTKVLGWDTAQFKDADELLQAELKGLGKQDNVAMFAFAAEPNLQAMGQDDVRP